MRRVVALVLSCGMLLIQSVRAEELEIEINDNRVDVTAGISPLSYGFLMTVKKGGDIKNNNNIFAVLEEQADEEGNVKFIFDMPAEKNNISSDGEYEVYVKDENQLSLIGSFIYANRQSRDALIEQIKASDTSESIESIMLSEENRIVLEAIGFGTEAYSSLPETDRLIVADSFMSDKATSMTQEELKDLFNCYVAIQGINGGEEDIDIYIKAANLKDHDDIRYEKIDDEERLEHISNYMRNNRPYSDIDELKTAYLQIDALYSINTAKFDKIDELFEKYSVILELDDNKSYEEYKDTKNSTAINKSLLAMIKKSMPLSIDELIEYFEEAVKSNSSSKSSGKSSGSSGGGGATNSKGAVVTVPTETVEVKKQAFDDMDDYAWASEAVTYLAEKEIIKGDGTGKFDGNKKMTREEFVTMLVKAVNVYDPVAICDMYEDINKDAWYYSAVASARNAKIVEGISEKEFGIGRKISRQDLMTMAYRAAKGNLPEAVRDYNTFHDDDMISDYAKDAVYQLYMTGVVNGMGENTFDPLAPATKAQGAQIIYGIFYKSKEV